MSNLKILKKKVLVTGANGLLGQKVVTELQDTFEVLGIGIDTEPVLRFENYEYAVCDIAKRTEVVGVVKSYQPQIVVNAAAYTNVDGSEDEKELCWRVNVTGVENLAYAAQKVHARMIQISTDYIFDGTADIYYENSKPSPLGYYGRSKLAGENVLIKNGADYLILRTMVLYGAGVGLRPNFATWLVDMLGKNKPVKIVDDQYGHPTMADDLAFVIKKMIELEKTGIYNVAGVDYDNRYNFAVKLAEIFGFDKSLITRIKTSDLNQKAPRPLNSRFNIDKLNSETGLRLKGLTEGLTELKRQLSALQS